MVFVISGTELQVSLKLVNIFRKFFEVLRAIRFPLRAQIGSFIAPFAANITIIQGDYARRLQKNI